MLSIETDPGVVVEAVCASLQRVAGGAGTCTQVPDSRHGQLYLQARDRAFRGACIAAEYRYEVEPVLEAHRRLLQHPIPWGSEEGSTLAPMVSQELEALRRSLWLITERYVPGLVTYPEESES